MPKVKLTSAFVRSALCPPDQTKIDFFDISMQGFLLEVRPSGGRTYYQRYSTERGQERQFKIGPADVLTLGQAKKKARTIKAEAILGTDPQADRTALKAIPTLKDFISAQYLPYVKTYKKSWKTDETVLRLHVIRELGHLFLDEVTTGAIAARISDMRAAGYADGTVGRVIVILRYLFNLASKWGAANILNNPAAGIPVPPDVQRNRFLSEKEIGRLLIALNEDENQTAAKAITLLLLTGGRRNEITHARWDHVDLENGTLLVPMSKNGKPRFILLNGSALDLLKETPRIPGNQFVFPTATGRPCASLHFPWKRIRARAGLSDVRIHDLRHSFASILINEGVPLYEIQHLLGHANAKTTQRYAHLTRTTLVQAAQVMSGVFDRAKPKQS